MKFRNLLLGAAAGYAAGYAAVRTLQAFRAMGAQAPQPQPRDPVAYGAMRRALTVSGIARSLASGAITAFGPVSRVAEGSVRRAPVWLQPTLFALQLAVVESFAEAPVDFVEGLDIERRYGLSEQSADSWAADYLKQQALGAAVTAVLAGLLGTALRKWPRTWPYIASAAALPLLLAANVAIPLWVLPLFNTYTPVEGELERRLRALAARFGAGNAEILCMNMSKQTKKANAFVIGIGGTHRIVVADTLVDHFPIDEVEFVVAHELGHYVSKDTWRFVAVGQAAAMATVFAAYAVLRRSNVANPSALAKVQFVALVLSQALRPALSAFARSREWAADRFALATTNAPATGASAFRRLRDQNLAEDEQPAWFEFMFSTHPSLRARIAALEGGMPGPL